MKIVSVVEKTIPILFSLRSACVDFSEMTAAVIAVVTAQFRDDRRVIDYAFNSFGRYACGGPLRERLIPRLLAARPVDINDCETGIVDPFRAVALMLAREMAGAHAERSMAFGNVEGVEATPGSARQNGQKMPHMHRWMASPLSDIDGNKRPAGLPSTVCHSCRYGPCANQRPLPRPL